MNEWQTYSPDALRARAFVTLVSRAVVRSYWREIALRFPPYPGLILEDNGLELTVASVRLNIHTGRMDVVCAPIHAHTDPWEGEGEEERLEQLRDWTLYGETPYYLRTDVNSVR